MVKFIADRLRVLVSGRVGVHLPAVALILLTGMVYGAGVFAPFTFDDYDLVVLNPELRSFDNLGSALLAGRPMRTLSLMIDYRLFGLNPQGYHLVNLLWHLLCGLLFYSLVYRIFRLPLLAGAAALLFCLHPAQTESVMAIAHRKELLAMAFMLLSYHAFLFRPRFPIGAPAFAFVFFALALFSKQVAIVLPVIFLGHWWLRREGEDKRLDPFDLLPLLAVGAALFLFGTLLSGPLLRDFDLFGKMAPAEIRELGYFRILATSLSMFPAYLTTLLFPVHLCLDPQVELTSFGELRPWLGAALFVGMAGSIFLLRRSLLASYSLLWIWVNLLPVMNWFPANHFYAERYLYIPSAGFCLLLAGLLHRLYREPGPILSPPALRVVGLVLGSLVLALLLVGPLSHRINALWHFQETYQISRELGVLIPSLGVAAVFGCFLFWFDRTRPGRKLIEKSYYEAVLLYLVTALMFALTVAIAEFLLRGRLGLPEKDLGRSAQNLLTWIAAHAQPGPRHEISLIMPTGSSRAEGLNLLVYVFGGAALLLFIYRRAARRALAVHPNRGLGVQLFLVCLMAMVTATTMRAGDWASSIRLWRATVYEEPRSFTGWNNLGKAYMDRGRCDRAAEAYREVVRLLPNEPQSYLSLAEALAQCHDYPDAIAAYEQTIKLNPRHVGALNNLANAHVIMAEAGADPDGYGKAIGYYLRALELSPDHAHSHFNLAYCYAKLGRFEEGLNAARNALAVEPGNAKYLELYRWLAAQVRKPRPPEPAPDPD